MRLRINTALLLTLNGGVILILERIVEQKKIQLAEEMKLVSIDGLKQRIMRAGLHKTQDFFGAIKKSGELSIIAEVKKASPSKGIIKEDFNPVYIAREYYSSNVQAISVLTEKNFFLGNDEHLMRIRQFIPLPVLRKDFIVDLWQVYQSRCLGADAILLIASILSYGELCKFQTVAGILGMQCLVEVHDRDDLEKALESEAKIIGINNRNLKTFEIELRTTESLIKHIPHGKAVVSESGIKASDDIAYIRSLGVDAVLIGEALMRAKSIAEKLAELRNE